MKNNMNLDDRICFTSGYVLTAITTINMMGIVQAAIIGLVGGFFGLVGKELYYYLKNKINK